MSSKILITGTNGTFGRLTVETLIAGGHQVAAAMRAPETRNRNAARALRDLGATIVAIDVTDDTSVEAGTKAAIDALGGLDVLVNNAGIGAHGIQEAFTPQQLLDLYDINVVGTHRVTRAVLPHFRDEHSGLIVNVSSLLGRLIIPFYGPYSAAKFALEALTETYRVELGGFGVDVALVEPGGFATPFYTGLALPGDQERLATLGEFAKIPAGALAGYVHSIEANPAQDPALVGEAILGIIDTPAGARAFRTIVDRSGVAEAVESHNAATETMLRTIYAAMGMSGMLALNRG
ncbi:MAG: SDR family NAD(P)-dependent oxidoreductase [Alphaproteobacteria bacterium]|nr:SDR family NAD(P)-dependent oxidoreductase [Alphaproteobacteria bacterium]